MFMRRFFVLLGCLAWILFGPTGGLPRYTLGLLAGMASGAAMLPYTVIKEANPPQYGGTATGVINFLNFTFSALLGPVFGWLLLRVSTGSTQRELGHYQTAFAPLLFGVAVAIVTIRASELAVDVRHNAGFLRSRAGFISRKNPLRGGHDNRGFGRSKEP